VVVKSNNPSGKLPIEDYAVDGSPTQITALLSAVGNGDAAAAERLWHTVYDELHRVAKNRMAQEGRRGDLQTTVLVQETYLRLVGELPSATSGPSDGGSAGGLRAVRGEGRFANRRHFFAAAAKAMRQFLVDNARTRDRLKRGGGRASGELTDEPALLEQEAAEVLSVHEALDKLKELDPRLAQLVELRYFAGLSVDDVAEALGCSPRQVDKDWNYVRTWMSRALG
jgi:RNA polymerase sigma factor (sigma-70 family)